MPRFFVDQQPQDGVLTLTGENAHHAGRVLRLRVGEGVTLCDGAGMDFDCTVEAVEKEAVTCRVVSCHAADTEPKQSITLFMALPKGDKMEFIVQKAVELGVSRIVPYLSKNCVSRPDKTEKKVERWRKIAAEAAKQCGRGRLPEVAAVVPVAQAIAQAAESETALFFYENERRTGLHDALAGGVRDTVSLMVGPEGGFDPEEIRTATEAAIQPITLGKRILRTETAGFTTIAWLMYQLEN